MVTAKQSMVARAINWFRPTAKVASTPSVSSVTRAGRELYAAMARYEAGQMGGFNRSWLPGFVQDARQDITPGERLEMVRKARYFERNSATMQKSLDLIETNVVGTGVHVTPASSSEEWNTRSIAWWNDWCKLADLTSRQSFETLQALMIRAQAVDGEIFVWLTEGEPDERGRRYPRIQLIETHRICDAKIPKNYIPDGGTLSEGIISDARGRPVAYVVTNDNDAFSKGSPKSVAVIPAEQMVHIYEPARTSQPHGITLYHACLHDLHDLDDLQQYEMLASKDAASRANIVKTKSGEMPDDGNLIGRPETAVETDGTLSEKITYYEKAFGAKTTVLHDGDDWKQGEALRPTAAQQEFWKILERKFCRGSGHSYAALCDYEGNWSGAPLRATLASDNRFYDVRTKTLVTGLQRIFEYVIGTQVRPGGDLSKGVPPDWKKSAWQSPRRSTVDIGRESAAMLNELRAGIRTFRDVLGEMGLDWRECIEQWVVERKFIADIAKKYDVPAGLILSMLGAAANTNVFGEKAAEAVDGPADPGAPISTDPQTGNKAAA